MRLVLRIFTLVHILLYKLTGGLIGSYYWKYPMALVTTSGRISNEYHTTPLGFMPDGERRILIASNGGSVGHPAWYKNLSVFPEVLVQFKRKTTLMRARTATGEERGRLWKLALTYYDYNRYQQRTKREIPVVILEKVPEPQ